MKNNAKKIKIQSIQHHWWPLLSISKAILVSEKNQQTKDIRKRKELVLQENLLVILGNHRCWVSHSNEIDKKWRFPIFMQFVHCSSNAESFTNISISLWKMFIYFQDLCNAPQMQKVFSLESQSPNISSAWCASKNVFQMKCFSFLPMLLVLSRLEVYCDIQSGGFGNWKICSMASVGDPKAKF